MSLARQPVFPAKPDGDVWVRTYAVRFTQGLTGPAHNHVWHQLSYASQGVLRVATDDSAWIVPPHRAVWIPAGVDHREEMRGQGTMRSLYLASGICRGLPKHCAVVNVPPLLRELILAAAVTGALDARKPQHKHLAQVIVDQLALLSPAEAQQLPMPRDARALAVAARLQKNPANDEDLAALGRRAGASKRTIQRLFLAETRLSFARWRQRMRLLAAVEHLGQGRSVTDAALDVGYSSVSAFVSSFRREFGVSPGKFGADAGA
jgi:AraC-like DNA-binding protein